MSDLVVRGLSWLGPTGSLCLISAICGVVFLLVFARFSNQAAIKRVKEKIHAAVLEAIVFRSDLKLSLKAQARMFLLSFEYIARALPPLLVLVPLCLPVLAQLNRVYGSSGLPVQKPAILEVHFQPSASLEALTIKGDDQVQVDGPVRDPSSKIAFYRVTPLKSGRSDITISSSGNEAAKIDVNALSEWTITGIATHLSNSWFSTLLYPSGSNWSRNDAIVSEVTLSYPAPSYSLFGLSMSWIVVFLVISLLAGLVASKILKIEV